MLEQKVGGTVCIHVSNHRLAGFGGWRVPDRFVSVWAVCGEYIEAWWKPKYKLIEAITSEVSSNKTRTARVGIAYLH